MARTTGPLMSMAASGSIAKTLTFAHWKGRPYVRQLVTPSNPRSAAQFYTRTMMGFLASSWKNIGSGPQAAWDTLAKQGNFSPFNAYQRFNMRLWTQGMSPQIDPNATAPNVQDVLAAPTITAGVGQISITQVLTTKHDGWGIAWAVDPANGATPPITLTQKIAYDLDFIANDVITTLITGLAPGTYSVQEFQFAQNGGLAAGTNATQGLVVL